MNVKIYPSKVRGILEMPYSKSYQHRAIIAASLYNERSIVNYITISADIMATIEALRTLGATISINNVDTSNEQKKSEHTFLCIDGIDIFSKINTTEEIVLDVNESGSTLRFLIPLCSLFKGGVRFIGKESLFSRPLDVYKELFCSQGLTFDLGKDYLFIKGTLSAGDYQIKGDISSQFITGLLLYLPILEKDSTITVLPPIESASYINITLSILKAFKIKIKKIEKNKYYIKHSQKYYNVIYNIESDYSHAANFMVLAALNNRLQLQGLFKTSIQGDKKMLNILQNSNVTTFVNRFSVAILKSSLDIKRPISLKNIPDLGPILIVASLFNQQKVILKDIRRLKLKESDRVKSMLDNLKLVGASIVEEENRLIINPVKLVTPLSTVFDSYNDHRIVYALAVLATMLDNPVTIKNASAINKAYPRFFDDLTLIGVKVEKYD
ncbi:MAG: 3-phosphoshikimate 1-carboxyvinyltransferase [Acholeplasmatales bacterium]|jgi:3-phosphoshikimate 1-carboxyvinyltransferase|nr:3-phosphoshikimate 1-carboxyvinyltransferase [Acholeplasmatales bacterium]